MQLDSARTEEEREFIRGFFRRMVYSGFSLGMGYVALAVFGRSIKNYNPTLFIVLRSGPWLWPTSW